MRVEFDGVEATDADELRSLGDEVEDAAFEPWEAFGFRKKRPNSLSARWDSGEPGPRAIYVIDVLRALPQPEELTAVLDELADVPRIVSVDAMRRPSVGSRGSRGGLEAGWQPAFRGAWKGRAPAYA